ncbi:TPA: hypothetical protein ACPJ19_001902 [Vibrio diabolicus]
MDSRIPLPTDNIYKFYALFGLLLFVFGVGSIIFVSQTANSQIYEIIVEYNSLKNIPTEVMTPNENYRFQLLDKKLDDAAFNKVVYPVFLSIVIVVGVLMMVYGFKVWHTVIQPEQNEITRLNIKKLKQEVGEQ